MISPTWRDQDVGGGRAASGLAFSEMRTGSCEAEEIWLLMSMPEAELPTTMTFCMPCQYFCYSGLVVLEGLAYFSLELFWPAVEFGVDNDAWVRRVKLFDAGDGRHKRIAVVAAGDDYGVVELRCHGA